MQTVRAGTATIDFDTRRALFDDGRVVTWGRSLVIGGQEITAASPPDALERAVQSLRNVAEQTQEAQADLRFMWKRGHLPTARRDTDGNIQIPGDITLDPGGRGRPRVVTITLEDRAVICQLSLTGGRTVRTVMNEAPKPEVTAQDAALASVLGTSLLALRADRARGQCALLALENVEYERDPRVLEPLRSPRVSDAQRAANAVLDDFVMQPSTDRYVPGLDLAIQKAKDRLTNACTHPAFLSFARNAAYQNYGSQGAIEALQACAADPGLAEPLQRLRDYLVVALSSLDSWEARAASQALAHDLTLPAWAKGAVVLAALREHAAIKAPDDTRIAPDVALRMLQAAADPGVQDRLFTAMRDPWGRLTDSALNELWGSRIAYSGYV